jgi:hypothetical protein
MLLLFILRLHLELVLMLLEGRGRQGYQRPYHLLVRTQLLDRINLPGDLQQKSLPGDLQQKSASLLA